MPKQKESKYAAKLLELGFKPSGEVMTKAQLIESERESKKAHTDLSEQMGFSRQQRRRFERMKLEPHFIYMEGWTCATDETGLDWIATKRVDLAPLGFKNTVKEIFGFYREHNPHLH